MIGLTVPEVRSRFKVSQGRLALEEIRNMQRIVLTEESTLRERLLAGERVLVQGKYTARKFQMGIVEASLGVRFLCAFDKGRAVSKENVLWGTETAERWLRGVRPVAW